MPDVQLDLSGRSSRNRKRAEQRKTGSVLGKPLALIEAQKVITVAKIKPRFAVTFKRERLPVGRIAQLPLVNYETLNPIKFVGPLLEVDNVGPE